MLACLPGFSQFIPTPLVLHDAHFPFGILSAPSYRSLIWHWLGYYLKAHCTCCSSLKRLLAEILQLTLDTFPRHAGVSSNPSFLTQIPFCSSSTQSSPDSNYPAFPILLVNICSLWIPLEWFLCLSYLGEIPPWKLECSYPLLLGTDTAVNNTSVSTQKEICSSEQNQSGIGKHSSGFPKLIKLFWNPGISTSLLCDVSLSRLREKANISHWIKVARPPTQSWKYTTKWYGSSFLICYRDSASAYKPLIYCPSSLLQIFNHYGKVCTVIFWL